MEKSDQSFRWTKFITIAACLLTLVFWIFFNIAKHAPLFASVQIFTEDPFDAVGSFGIQLAALAALISLVRILRPYPNGISTGHLSFILRGAAVSLLSIAVTMIADGIAMFRYLSAWTGSTEGWLLAGLTGGLMVLTAFVLWKVIQLGQILNIFSGTRPWGMSLSICTLGGLVLAVYPETWRQSIPGAILTAVVGMAILFVLTAVIAKLVFPAVEGQSEDFLDDLLAIHQSTKSHAKFAAGFFRRVEKCCNYSPIQGLLNWLDPGKHAWNFVILLALAMGLGLVLVEAFSEGAPARSVVLMVLSVFIGIEGMGVLLGYALFRQYLGIFHR